LSPEQPDFARIESLNDIALEILSNLGPLNFNIAINLTDLNIGHRPLRRTSYGHSERFVPIGMSPTPSEKSV
jgi:hypothetical protein